MIKTLWLPSWYPSKTSSQNGDFIQRHAQAVSLFADVYVLYVVPNHDILSAKEIVFNQSKNLTEEIVYYKKKRANTLNNIFSVIKYFRLYKKHIKKYIQQHGKPDIVHIHVAMRAGILALWLKRKYKIPFVVTEHWTGYTKEDPNNFYTQNFLFKHYAKKVFKQASDVLPVSNHLGKNIREMVSNVPFTKVPNVVKDAFYFGNNDRKNKSFTFIHVSTLTDRKNPQGILRSFYEVWKSRNDILLKMVGRNFDSLKKYASSLGIPDNNIIFTGELSNHDVAEEILSSNVFILFSRSENLPCVIAESVIAGLPVIGSDVGGVAEMINEDNGILVASEDEDALVNAMKEMIKNYAHYDRKKIAANAIALYNYTTIGKQIADIYDKALHK